MNAAALTVRPITSREVRELRHAVLRPFDPPEKLVYSGDEDPDTLHAGAFDGETFVGIATVTREPLPGSHDLAHWRLRGMATVSAVRGRGFGCALLERCFAHIRAKGGTLLWCNARVLALGFYEHLGFVAQGEEFEIVPIGPHYVMTRTP